MISISQRLCIVFIETADTNNWKMSSMHIILCLCLLPYIFCDNLNVTMKPKAEGYFWRDYTGEVPVDAIKGGIDTKERTIYIGQTLKSHPYGAIIVGDIDPVKKKMHYGYEGNAITVTENIKILCSQYQENFEWITTNHSIIGDLNKNDFVVGGYDTYPLYIGRIQHGNGPVAVGKVTLDPRWESFAYVVGDAAIFIKPTFEILLYKSHKK